MKILTIALDWYWGYDADKFEVALKRRAALERAKVEVPEGMTDDEICRAAEFTVSEKQVVDLMLDGIEFKIKKQVKIHDDLPNLARRLEAILVKMETMKGDGKEFNEKVHVHMPGNALMSFNVTMLLEDACTDQLQQTMDRGWRIISVCPQPDQRRPDYILGRFDPTHVPGDGAYRV